MAEKKSNMCLDTSGLTQGSLPRFERCSTVRREQALVLAKTAAAGNQTTVSRTIYYCKGRRGRSGC